jgi:predicted metal-binding membrane protein
MRAGAWCVGCSWALMAVLFALGVMNLAWMSLVAALVAFQKVSPARRAAVAVTAALLATLPAGILFAADDVPGFVVPVHASMPMQTMTTAR